MIDAYPLGLRRRFGAVERTGRGSLTPTLRPAQEGRRTSEFSRSRRAGKWQPWPPVELTVLALTNPSTIAGLPDAWIGAGVIRDVIWGQLHAGFNPATVHDIDVAFFGPTDLSRQHDQAADQRLHALADDLPWEAKNQAAVHTWCHQRFGGPPVEALTCIHDAIATWPETATAVAIRRTPDGIDVCAPHGLDDLLNGVWRRNPERVTIDRSQARLARRRPAERWPSVTVISPA